MSTGAAGTQAGSVAARQQTCRDACLRLYRLLTRPPRRVPAATRPASQCVGKPAGCVAAIGKGPVVCHGPALIRFSGPRSEHPRRDAALTATGNHPHMGPGPSSTAHGRAPRSGLNTAAGDQDAHRRPAGRSVTAPPPTATRLGPRAEYSPPRSSSSIQRHGRATVAATGTHTAVSLYRARASAWRPHQMAAAPTGGAGKPRLRKTHRRPGPLRIAAR